MTFFYTDDVQNDDHPCHCIADSGRQLYHKRQQISKSLSIIGFLA